MKQDRTGTGDVRWVRVDDITIDLKANRGKINRAHVQKIKDTFDPKVIGVVELSERTDGTLVALDGMHRVTALKELGRGDSYIRAIVNPDLTPAEEAGTFIGLNTDLAPAPITNYLKRLEHGEPDFVAMDEIVQAAGLRVAGGKTAGTTQAVGAIQDLYKRDTGKTLSIVLHVIVGAWGTDDRDAISAMSLRAFGLLLGRYGDRLDVDDLASKLSAVRADQLIAQGRGNHKNWHVSIANGMAMAIVEAYNRGRRSGRLEPFIG